MEGVGKGEFCGEQREMTEKYMAASFNAEVSVARWKLVIKRHVQFKYIDARFAEESQVALLDA
jgi:hypothetical protein